MRKVTKIKEETLVDIAIEEYGGLEGIISLAKLNGLAIDATLSLDTLLMIDEDVESVVRKTVPLNVSISDPLISSEKLIQNGQNIIDLVIQEYGSVEGIISFLRSNGLAPTGDPTTNSVLKIDLLAVTDKNTRNYFAGRFINTGYTAVIIPSNSELREDFFYILREDGYKFTRET